MRTGTRSQFSPDHLGQPLIQTLVLAVDLPVLLLLDGDRAPLIVGQEGVPEVSSELSLSDCCDYFADKTV